MKMFGFGDDNEYDDYDEQDEMPRAAKRPRQAQMRETPMQSESPRLVFFRGVPSEGIKLKLRDALLQGIMVLLDLTGDLEPRELDEKETSFITFMTGVAFAHRGCTQRINQGMYLLTPHEGMFEEWIEEELLDDGSFDRQGR